MPLPPEIGEAAEPEALQTEEILHSPDCGELERHLGMRAASFNRLVIMDIFVQYLDVQCIPEILAVDEPVEAEKAGVIDSISLVNSSVVFHMEAERRKLGVLPEIEAAGNLEVSSPRGYFLIVHLLTVIIIDEEESVAPFVTVEALEGGGDMLPVFSEVVENLKVSLRLGRKSEGNGCGERSQNCFF